MRTRRLLAALGATGLLLLLAAPAASAHAVLLKAVPADGTTVATAPGQLQLTFDEAVSRIGAYATLTGPSGVVTTGTPSTVDETMSVPVQGAMPAGPYAVAWRVVSADGHPVSGTVHFTTTSGAAAQAAAAPAAAAKGRSSSWVGSHVSHVAVAAVVVLLAVGYLGYDLRARRR
ncbi:hypothetical protein EV189_1683 [Motilibacter rhizosphaerae]|uniref:CopC domain-containing protein n=1 Tax=Motilibacter rhizosphaerae TaxID=598652 RepID=A0A4Q7NSH0_9ACTN|nr:copper resistance CopC family protein [Motilibacter rhizosphaerae]RZS89904.1 hypothetical protein EV189_1683 [Motilibacter rhizosphaerae]